MKQLILGVALVGAASGGAAAQAPRPAPMPQEQVQARYNIFVMEGVLERAVEHGADRLRRQVRRVVPDMLLLSGGAEARGFRLDGYGVFFDVEVPVLRRSVAWSLRTMIDENGVAASTALQQLKAFVEAVGDPRQKTNLLQAIKRLELQVGPAHVPGMPGMAAGPRRTVTAAVEPMPQPAPGAPSAPADTQTPAAAAPAAAPNGGAPPDADFIEDPNGAYEREVISALIDAMLDHSGPLRVGPEEWLTVAARDNEHRDRLMPGDPYDLLTIVLRIKGSDLSAYRAERITKEEARKRVEVREF